MVERSYGKRRIIYRENLTGRKLMHFFFLMTGLLFVAPISYMMTFRPDSTLFLRIAGAPILIATIIGLTYSLLFIFRANIKIYSDRYERLYATSEVTYNFDEIVDMKLYDKKVYSYIILLLENGEKVKAAMKVDRKPLKKLYKNWKKAWKAYREGEPLSSKEEYTPPGFK